MLIDKWRHTPWSPLDLKRLSSLLAEASDHSEELADRFTQLEAVVDELRSLLKRHGKPGPTGLRAQDYLIGPEEPESNLGPVPVPEPRD